MLSLDSLNIRDTETRLLFRQELINSIKIPSPAKMWNPVREILQFYEVCLLPISVLWEPEKSHCIYVVS